MQGRLAHGLSASLAYIHRATLLYPLISPKMPTTAGRVASSLLLCCSLWSGSYMVAVGHKSTESPSDNLNPTPLSEKPTSKLSRTIRQFHPPLSSPPYRHNSTRRPLSSLLFSEKSGPTVCMWLCGCRWV